MDKNPNPAKKLKVTHNHCVGSSDISVDSVQPHKASKPFAVLATRYTRPLETVLVYVADLVNPKLASKCIRELNGKYPLDNLQHLKRVRRISHKDKGTILQVLIKKVVNSDMDGQACENIFGQDKDLSQPYTIEVPKYQPLTRKQFDEASKLWPSSFHEDKYVGKMISGELFSDNDVTQINNYMSLAIQAAKKGKAQGMVSIGAIVVDPNSDNVLAIAHDLRKKGHPLQHVIMIVIDLIAQRQSGGAWNLGYQQDDGIWVLRDSESDGLCDEKPKSTYGTNILCDDISKTSGLCDSDTGRLCDDCKGGLCNIDTDTLGDIDTNVPRNNGGPALHDSDISGLHGNATSGLCDIDTGGLRDTCNDKQQESYSKTSQEKKDKTGPYLCTGYDLYVTREPCVMCAMSLVHSRIRRVFYGSRDSNIGALGSVYDLHVQEGLNHHYEVFRDVLQDQCDELITLSS